MPKISFEIVGNAQELYNALEGSAQVTTQLARDFQTISEGMEGIISRADRIRTFFKDNVDLLSQMKEILQLISSINEANQSAMNTNLQAIREMMTSVTRMGGNISDVTKLVASASPAHAGAASGAQTVQDLSAVLMQQMMFSGANNTTREAAQPDDFSKEGKRRASMLGRRMRSRQAPPAGYGGGRRESDTDPEDYEDTGGYGGAGYRAPRASEPTEYTRRPITKVSPLLRGSETGYLAEIERVRRTLETNPDFEGYRKSRGFRDGREEYAALDAYDYSTRRIDSIFGTRGIGGKIGGYVKRRSYGSRQDIKDEIDRLMATTADEHAWESAYNDPNNVLNKVLKRASTQAGQGGALGALGKMGSLYGDYKILSDIAGIARVGTQYAQQQGGVFGTVDYGRTAGLTMDAGLRSGFGLNPFYSFKDASQAQNYGGGIGYRGAALTSYENVANRMQTQLGMSQQQTAQAVGGMQNYGMGAQQTMQMLSSVRNAGQGSQFFNASAATQAAITAQGSAMGWGSTGSGTLGNIASKFSSYSPTMAGTGLTGQDLMNTQFGTALVANSLGVSYNSMYSQRQKMSEKQYAHEYTKDVLQLITSSLGINVASIKKQSDLNQYAMMLLPLLQGMGINVADPQHAVGYVWGLIKQLGGTKNTAGSNTVSTASGGADMSMFSRGPASFTGRGASYHSGPPTMHHEDPKTTPTPPTPGDGYTAASRVPGTADSHASKELHVTVGFNNKHAEALLQVLATHQRQGTDGTTRLSGRPPRGEMG